MYLYILISSVKSKKVCVRSEVFAATVVNKTFLVLSRVGWVKIDNLENSSDTIMWIVMKQFMQNAGDV
jgi:hypothetical protein